MKRVSEKFIIFITILLLAACLPDSTSKWSKNKNEPSSTSGSSGSSSDNTSPPADEEGNVATLTDLKYSQDILLIKLHLETDSESTQDATTKFSEIFPTNGTYNPLEVDGVTLNQQIPRNANPPSGTVTFDDIYGIYITSIPDGDGNYARGIITGLNSSAQYIYVKVLTGSFSKDDNLDINYYYYSKKTSITEITHVFSTSSTITPMTPTIVPSGFTGLSYTVSPPLPTGLTLDFSTGTVVGVPTAETKATYTFAVRESNGSAFAKEIKILTTSEPKGLGASTNAILVVSSTAGFKVGSYVSAPQTLPSNADENSLVRSETEYPWGIIKEIISSTKMLIQIKSGQFIKGDLLDNTKRYENVETVLGYEPLPVSSVLTVQETVPTSLNTLIYDVEVALASASRPALLASSLSTSNMSGILTTNTVRQTASGQGIVMHFDNTVNPKKIYVLATKNNFTKGEYLFDNWDADLLSAAPLGTVTFLEADNIILRVGSSICQRGGGHATRDLCVSAHSSCTDGIQTTPKDCNAVGQTWQPDYYAWRGFENFSAGMDVSNNPNAAAANCDGTNSCKGVGFVNYVDETNREIHIRVSNYSFGSDYAAGNGEEIDNLNVYNNTSAVLRSDKALVSMVLSSNHYDLYVDENFTLSAQLFQGQNSSYAISPNLPEGLTLNGETGMISGKVLTKIPRADYILTAHSGNSDSQETFEFSLAIHAHFTISTDKNFDNTYPRTHVMHRLGKGNHNQACRFTEDQINYGHSPSDPEVTNTRRISCFLEIQEEELHFSGLSLKAQISSGLCEYLEYTPYSYFAWKYRKSYPGVDTQNLTYDNIIELSFRTITNNCDIALYSSGGINVPFEETKIISSNGTGGGVGGWIDHGEDASVIHGDGDYTASDGPNCDDGSYNHTIINVENDDSEPPSGCIATSTLSTIEVEGDPANCVNGPVRQLSTYQADQIYNGVIYSMENSTVNFEKNWNYPGLRKDSIKGLNGKNLGGNRYYANYVAKNSCAGGEALYGTNNLHEYFFDGWKKYAYDYDYNDFTTMLDPFKGSQPFYHFVCYDAAREPKAEIFLMVREWDRKFNPITNLTDSSNSAYNQEIDQLFPGAVLPLLSGQILNYNNPDHLLENAQVDMVDEYYYDDFRTWDSPRNLTWTTPATNASDYHGCFHDMSMSTVSSIAPTQPSPTATSSAEWISFPEGGN